MTLTLLDKVITSDGSGFACSKSKLVQDGLLHIRPFNIGDSNQIDLSQRYLVPLDEAPNGKTTLVVGDVLFNNTNSVELVGKSALVTSDMQAGFSNHISRIRLDRKLIEPAYFAYWLALKRSQGYFSANATQWVSQAAFKTSELRKLSIELPTLPEQRQIVDLLSRAESIVRLRREAQQKAAELVPAIFYKLFGDPAPNSKQLPTKTLGELVTLMSGGTPSKARDDYWHGPLPWVSPKDMKKNEISDSIDHVSEAVLHETNLKLVPTGSLLIVVRGMILVHSVPIAITSAPVVINQDMKALLPSAIVDPIYLLWALKGQHARILAQVDTAAHGTKKLDTAKIEAIKVAIPSAESQQEFRARCTTIDSMIRKQKMSIEIADRAFNSLLAVAFSSS